MVTAFEVEGGKTTIGLVRGSTIRARHFGKDTMAGVRGMVGGEIAEYTKMMAEAREQATQRMIKDSEYQGANAVVGFRYSTAMVMQNAAEVLAYRTGVVVE